jgi:hypothetical protein
MGACGSVCSRGDVIRPPKVDIEDKRNLDDSSPQANNYDSAQSVQRRSHTEYSHTTSEADSALLIATLNPAATNFVVQGAAEAVVQTGNSLIPMATSVGHIISETGSLAVHAITDFGESAAHVISEAGSLAVHAITDFGESAAAVGVSALEVAGEVGSNALHALVDGGSAAVIAVAELGSALAEHGGAALMLVGEAAVTGGSAIIQGAVAVGEFAGGLAEALG